MSETDDKKAPSAADPNAAKNADDGKNPKSSDSAKDTKAAPKNPRKRRLVLGILIALFLLGGLIWFLLYLFVFSKREKTDDAYVGGNQVVVSAVVTGTVVELLADETQYVERGQVVVRLDPTDAAVGLSQASSQLAEAVRQVRQQFELARQYDAAIAQRKLDLDRARKDLERRVPLLAEHAVAPEEVAHARDIVANAAAALDAAERQSAATHALVDNTTVEQHPTVLRARAAFRQAWLNNERNGIVAPTSGYVAKRTAQLGQRVAPGQALLAIIPLDTLWVDANFKEGQLRNVRIGQPVEVESDLYGGDVTYHGKVSGLGPGSGSAFALLPPQNASGNWIKVVQRVPVRVMLDPNELKQHPLRIGLSTTVKVNTEDRSGAMLAQTANTAPIAKTDVYDRESATADALADRIVRDNLAR